MGYNFVADITGISLFI